MTTKTNLFIDLTILAAFLVIFSPYLTGNRIVKRGGEFFKKLLQKSHLNFLVNGLFFIVVTGSIFSGLFQRCAASSVLTAQPVRVGKSK